MADQTVRDAAKAQRKKPTGARKTPAHDWVDLVAAAEQEVRSAKEGDPHAGLEIVFRSEVALRSWFERAEQPSPRDRVHIYSLLESLASITKADAKPAIPRHVRPQRFAGDVRIARNLGGNEFLIEQ